MEACKTEEYYYIKVSPSMPSKVFLSAQPRVQRYGQIDFQYPPCLSINKVERNSKQNRLFQDTQTNYSQFYQIGLEKCLTKAQLQSTLFMKLSQVTSQDQKTVNTFEIKLSDFMKSSTNRENFTDKHVISSVDSMSNIEITVIPSFNPLSYPTLEKIMSHEDSKLTVDSFSRLENLSTQQSLGYLERKGKFKRSSIQNQLKYEKKSKLMNQGIQVHYVKGLKLEQLSPQSPKKGDSPIKRCLRMRRSQLIPQEFYCEMEQIDENQTWQHYKKHAQSIVYILALLLQLAIVIQLMSPSSKI